MEPGENAVKRKDLAQAVARSAGVPPGEARDRVDEMVHKILRSLRQGRAFALPGVGKLVAPANSTKRTQ